MRNPIIISKAPVNEWVERAICSRTDPDLFTSTSPSAINKAKAICQRCPVIEECLDHAIANKERSGVWGGKSPSELRSIIAKKRLRF